MWTTGWRLDRRPSAHAAIDQLIPDTDRARDRRHASFVKRTVRQLFAAGAFEQAWALIEIGNELHRYTPGFQIFCDRARKKWRRHVAERSFPWEQFSGAGDCQLLSMDPQAIRNWGCVIFPGVAAGRFWGRPQQRFCHAVFHDRYILDGLPLKDDPVVQVLQRRFQEGLSWEASGGKAKFEERRQRRDDGHTTWTSYRRHQLNNWDRLFETIQREGYRTQSELQSKGAAPARYGLFNEVEVCVSGRGDVLFLEGKHRLVMAQILGLPSLPVVVNGWSESFLHRLPPSCTVELAQRYIKACR